jgi:hypothetical protein
VLDALDRYNGFLAQLEEFPGWKDKFEAEVGNWLHQIHNNLQDSNAKKEIFLKMVILSLFCRTGRNISSEKPILL